MNDIQKFKRRNFGKALPFSSLVLTGIGILFPVLIYMETGWSWHVPLSPVVFGGFAAMIYWFYREGSAIIEISPQRISIISGSKIKKAIAYSEIEALKYIYVPGYKPPTIELKCDKCKIDFDAEMEDFPSAVTALFRKLRQKGREDLIEAYNQQVQKEHNIKGISKN